MRHAENSATKDGGLSWKGKGMHLYDECIHAATPVRETKASRASDYGRSSVYRQNTSDLSILRETRQERTA